MSSRKLKIAIDAGHGLKTAGKRCMKKLDPNQTREWVLNDRIADRLQEALKSYNCETLRVDDTTGAKDISLSSRVKAANNWGADVYMSIHFNAGVYGGAGGGTVVFYYSPETLRKEQAQRLYNLVTDETRLYGNRSERVKKKGFYVIKYTNMPAFLIENGFMDSSTDVPIILSLDHTEKTVRGLLNFLVSEYKLTGGSGTVSSVNSTSFKVKVTVDSLNIRSGAGVLNKVVGAITDNGIYTIVKVNGNWGYLKSGAGWINISEKYVKRV